jgi:predicted nucleic acid-binding protein
VTDEHLVLDASAMIDLVVTEVLGAAVEARIDGAVLHAPAHLDAEVLSGLGRLHRAGRLSAPEVARHLGELATAPIERHSLQDLLAGGWKLRGRLRLADALYVELATRLGVPLVTTDVRLSKVARIAEAVTV